MTLSRDHDRGMRLTLLVESASLNGLSDYLDAHLPDKVHGHPTSFSLSNDPTIRHRIDIDTAERFTAERLGFDATARINALEWLATSSQSILEVTKRPVFADTIGTLTEIRRRLRWYPDEVWRYVVATSWARLAEELPLMSRARIRGDQLGASIIAARLLGVAMRLGFQLERAWAPYPKWFGAAFTALPRASARDDGLSATLRERSWQERQHHIAAVCKYLYAFKRSSGLRLSPARCSNRSMKGRFSPCDRQRSMPLCHPTSTPALAGSTSGLTMLRCLRHRKGDWLQPGLSITSNSATNFLGKRSSVLCVR